MAVVFFSSCQKEDDIIVSDSEILAMARKKLPSEKEILTLIEADILSASEGNLKSAEKEGIKPTVSLIMPNNDLYLNEDGTYKQVWAWVIISENYLKDQGVVVINYSNEFMITSWQILIGWENNEYCNPVTIKTNARNIQMGLTFYFPVVGGGNLSFQTFSNCNYDFEIWLPILKYNLAWQVYSGAQFGGVLSFDLSNEKELNILVGDQLDVNTYFYLKYELVGVGSNSKVMLYIYDEDGNYVERSILLPKGEMIPPYVMIPLTFKPYSVYYQYISFKSGMAEILEYGNRKCYIIPGTGISEVSFWSLGD